MSVCHSAQAGICQQDLEIRRLFGKYPWEWSKTWKRREVSGARYWVKEKCIKLIWIRIKRKRRENKAEKKIGILEY